MHSIEVWGPLGIAKKMEADAPEGTKVKYETSYHQFSSTGLSGDVFTFYFTIGVSSQLAALLYDLIKKHCKKAPEKITIDRTTIIFDKGEI